MSFSPLRMVVGTGRRPSRVSSVSGVGGGVPCAHATNVTAKTKATTTKSSCFMPFVIVLFFVPFVLVVSFVLVEIVVRQSGVGVCVVIFGAREHVIGDADADFVTLELDRAFHRRFAVERSRRSAGFRGPAHSGL